MNKLLLIASVLLFSVSSAAAQWTFSGVDRVVAMSDIHGAHDTFVSTLRTAGVVDEAGRWVGDRAHLVVVGDLLDRGPDSRKTLDFLMRLEDEALAAGGRVHVLVGNHEVMNLVGDLRYVSTGEYAAFADEADTAERDRWYSRVVERDGESAPTRDAFDTRYPPGFFAHRKAFSKGGQYGKWLLQKPIMVVINETAFVHGGLSPMVAELGLDGINGQLMDDVRDYLDLLQPLYSANVLLPTDEFFDHPAVLERFEAPDSTELGEQIESLARLNLSPVHDSIGPLWYRGNIACNALVEIDRLEESLAAIGARRVVIGHTPTPTREVTTRFDGRVIEVDTGIYAPAYGGFGTALILQGDSVSSVREPSAEQHALTPHPRQVGTRPGGFLPLDETLSLLEHGDIVAQRDVEGVGTVVTVGSGDRSLEARFDVVRGKGFYPELAAFRLDQHLELDIVPATVIRTIGRKTGTLQLYNPSAINEEQRASSGRGGGAHCPLADQWKAMYQFDALIYNDGRSPETMLYDQASGWQLMSAGHQRAFVARDGAPDYLKSVDWSLNAEWKRRLTALTDEQIAASFTDVLDKRRRRFLAKRRDAMLAE